MGRALQEFYADLPFWTFTNIVFAAALLPVLALLARGNAVGAAVSTLPPLFILAGIINAASRTVGSVKPRWRDLFKGSRHAVVALWLALIFIATAFQTTPAPVLLGVLVIFSVTILMPLVLALALSSWESQKGQKAWRSAAELTILHPITALGLLALMWILGWITVTMKGAPLLVLPALWANVAAYAISELTQNLAKRDT